MAGVWSIGGHGLSHVIRLGSNLIMTRLLVPEMFGIMAIAHIVMVGLALFTDTGAQLSIIRSKRGEEAIFQNTVWCIQIIRGVIIWFMALLLAYCLFLLNEISWFRDNTVYSNPSLPFVISAVSFTAVITGFQSTRQVVAARNFDQKYIVFVELASLLVTIICMIIWAFVDRSIWALVAGALIGSVSKVIFSYTLVPGINNRWEWDKKVLSEVYHFGKWIFLSSILGFLFVNGDRLLLGGLISSDMLGIYSIAFMILSTLQGIASRITDAVIFPVFSVAIRDEDDQAKEIYYKYRVWLDSIFLFIVGFLTIAGGLIIELLYDERYQEAGDLLPILSLIIIAQRYNIADQYYLAIGKPKLPLILATIRIIVLYSSVPLSFQLFGFIGVVWAIVLSYFASVPYAIYLTSKYIFLDFKRELITIPLFIIGVFSGKLVLLLVEKLI